jgi:cytochrome c-type biogenesis protein CcmH/NrfG
MRSPLAQIAVLLAVCVMPCARAQQPQGSAPATSHPPAQVPDKPKAVPPNTDANYDPFHAEQDMEVGTFYMHKGDLDAAAERFKDAIRLKPNYARPRLLLGEIYEKKGDKQEAVRYYKEFLQIMPPGSPDTRRVQKKVEKLSAKK